jgi:predicted Zn-dependent protease
MSHFRQLSRAIEVFARFLILNHKTRTLMKTLIKNLKFGKWIAVLLVSSMIYACAKVPLTGRRQLKLLPESDLVAMSLTSYDQFLDTSEVIRSGNQQAMIKRVGEKISKAVEEYLVSTHHAKDTANYKWEFNLVNDPSVNAWCMPGGKVVFYTGILPICETETGVAVVMGHEIAHAVARHGNERMSQGIAQQLGGVALSVAVAEKPQQTQQLYALAYGLGTNVGLMLPFSRLHESEADQMGLMFMAMAGYNPEEAPKFWERMNSKAGGQRPPVFLSTHPDPDRRSERMTELMPKALKYYNAED